MPAENLTLYAKWVLAGTDNLKYVPFFGGTEYGVSGINTTINDVVIIPDTYNGKPVTMILSYAFSDEMIDSVYIGNNVTCIAECAFYESSVKNVYFGKNSKLETINSSAFEGCTYLESFEAPDSLINIGEFAFVSTTSLKTFTFGENSKLKFMGYNLFFESGIQSINIPNGIISLGTWIFDNCYFLKTVTFGSKSKINRY